MQLQRSPGLQNAPPRQVREGQRHWHTRHGSAGQGAVRQFRRGMVPAQWHNDARHLPFYAAAFSRS